MLFILILSVLLVWIIISFAPVVSSVKVVLPIISLTLSIILLFISSVPFKVKPPDNPNVPIFKILLLFISKLPPIVNPVKVPNEVILGWEAVVNVPLKLVAVIVPPLVILLLFKFNIPPIVNPVKVPNEVILGCDTLDDRVKFRSAVPELLIVKLVPGGL